MVIKNRWKEVLSRSGLTQADVAEAAGVSKPLFSLVVNGQAMLAEKQLDIACETLDIEPQNVYSLDVLKAVYGAVEVKERETTVSIKLCGEDARAFLDLRGRMGEGTNIGAMRTMIEHCGGYAT